jgi:hypothetical protein
MRLLFLTVATAAFSSATPAAYPGTPLNARDTFLSDHAKRGLASPPDVERETFRSASSPQQQKPRVLTPIHPAVFESAAGIRVRDTVEFDSLPPATQAQMAFGSPGSKLHSFFLSSLGFIGLCPFFRPWADASGKHDASCDRRPSNRYDGAI